MKPKVIAEIGCNHKGNMETAREMINVASIFCKVDCVKFQKRNPKELLSDTEYNTPHPNPTNAYGETYGAHREFLEFDLDQHKQLKKWCEEMNLIYSTSVWDITSALEIITLQPDLMICSSSSLYSKPTLNIPVFPGSKITSMPVSCRTCSAKPFADT